jgi:transcriptional regulator, GntR family
MSVDADDVALVRKANQAGLAVQALSRWRITSAGKGGILLSFTNISSLEIAQQAAYQLRLALT